MGAKNKITENSVKLPTKKRGNKGKTRQDIELQHRIEDEILSLILDKNYSLNKAAKEVGISASTFHVWCSKNAKLKERYELASNARIEALFDEILEISDNTEIGITEKTTQNGVETTRGDMIAHRRLKIDARKWFLSKVAPKRFGDKVEIDQKIDGNINVKEVVQIYLPDNNRNDDNNEE